MGEGSPGGRRRAHQQGGTLLLHQPLGRTNDSLLL
jgi:hypothetical protein